MNKNKSALKILLIEDNAGDLILIQDYLEEYFKSTHQSLAGNFATAETILKEKVNYFDIILLDLSLPDLDGMPLIEAMLLLAPDIPLIILTGYTDIPFSILTLNHGASDYLLKDELTPFSLYKSIIHNIERKKHVKDLEKSQKKYSELFQLSPQPLIIYNTDNLSIINVNKTACQLYGYSFEEFVALSILDIRPKEEADFLLQEFDRIMSSDLVSETYTGIFQHQKKTGEVFIVEVYSNQASHLEKNIRVSLINDVSEKIKYTEKIEDQNKRLKNIAWIQSHVVRAPLSRIMGLIDLMTNVEIESDEDERKFILENINNSAQELDEIIKDITAKATKFNTQNPL